MSTNCVRCVINPRNGYALLCSSCQQADKRKKLEDPNSDYNQRCLAELRVKYPTMTAEEMIADRKRALNEVREAMRSAGYLEAEIPADDGELMKLRWLMGVLGGAK